MKHIFYTTILTCLLLSCSENTGGEKDKQSKGDKSMHCNEVHLDQGYNHFYIKDRTKPYTGCCTVIDKQTQQLLLKKCFKNGKLDGLWEEYYSDGSPKNLWEFKANRQHGVSKSYDELGNLIMHIEYYKGDFKKDLTKDSIPELN